MAEGLDLLQALSPLRLPPLHRFRVTEITMTVLSSRLPCAAAPRRALIHRLRRLIWLAAATGTLMVVLGALLLTAAPTAALAAQSEQAGLPRAVAEMEQLDRMRVSLASTLEGRSEEPTMETMKEVCKPVGMRAMAIGKENGWQVRQVASKYRNPDHAPAGPQEKQVIDLLERHAAAGAGAGGLSRSLRGSAQSWIRVAMTTASLRPNARGWSDRSLCRSNCACHQKPKEKNWHLSSKIGVIKFLVHYSHYLRYKITVRFF